MNIGIDIDDTVTCTYETLLNLIAVRYGMNFDKIFAKRPTYDKFDELFPNYRSFVKENFPIMARMIPLREHVVETLTKLQKQGHKIIFISARNRDEYKDPYKVSYDYLKANRVPFDKLIVEVKDKAKECVLQEIDLFIDDNFMSCAEVENVGIETLQFKTIYNAKDKFKKVESWEDVYKKVQEMYT